MLDDADNTSILTSLLAWYRETGADEAIGDNPIDWMAHGPSAPGAAIREKLKTVPAVAVSGPATAGALSSRPTAVTPQAPHLPPRQAPPRPAPPRPSAQLAPAARAFPASSPDVSQQAARTAAAAVTSLAGLEAALQSFDGCGLKATAKNLCLYRGAERARVMMIGEAPGRDEDLAGKPFVGPAGQLLDRMLASIGLSEANVHITNIVYWRPPGNRTPTPQEAIVCRPFLDRQVALVEPDFVIPLGGAAAKHILDVSEGIMRLRGRWQSAVIGGRTLQVLPTLHPAYLLRTPAAKRLAWRDLLLLKAAL